MALSSSLSSSPWLLHPPHPQAMIMMSVLSPRMHTARVPLQAAPGCSHSSGFVIMSSRNGGGNLQQVHHHHHHHHQMWPHHLPPRSPHAHPLSAALSLAPTSNEQDPILLEDPKVEELMELVRGELVNLGREMGKGDGSYVYEALSMVDLIQRLGIARFFEHEIQSILHGISEEWDEQLGLKDKDATVIAFHLLRLHGYSVSSEVLKRGRDENGGFFSLSIDSPKNIISLINLYKCSQVSFPHEVETMVDVEEFAKSQLQKALLEGSPSLLSANNLEIEIRFALEYPRKCLLSRFESRSIIRQMWPSNGWRKWCLELAKIDLEMLQRLHHQEIQLLEQWWEAQGFKEVPFARPVVKKCFLAIAAAIFEPQFAACRAAFTKSACLATIIDDLFDLPDYDPSEISSFSEAVQRWDPSLLADLKEHRVIFTSICRTAEDTAQKASRIQNRELLPLYKSLWKEYTAAVAKWRIDCGRVPPLDEYLDSAIVSIGGKVCSWTSVFLIQGGGEPVSESALRAFGEDSRLTLLSGLIARLANDIMTLDREAECGELASAVTCYREGREGCTKQEGVEAVHGMIEASCRELEWELFKSARVAPRSYARVVSNVGRTGCFLYKRADGFSNDVNDRVYEDMLRDYLVGPLNL